MKDDIQRIDELAGKLRRSELSDADQAELDALLQRGAEARRRFVGHLILENDLHEDAGGLLAVPIRTGRDRKWTVWLRPIGMAAVLALGIWVVLQAGLRSRGTDDGSRFTANGGEGESLQASVAVVRRAIGGEAVDEALSLHSGQVLYPGPVTVSGGLVQLDLYSGVSLVLEGPAQMEIVSTDLVILYSGKVRANVPAPARGFRLIAGEHELVDLGTEFGVSLDPDGGGELHVIDGEVEIQSKLTSDDGTKLLTTGNAVSLNRDGSSLDIPADAAKFSGTAALTERGAERFVGWEKTISGLANDPDTIALFDFQSTADNRLRNLAINGAEGTEGVVVGCRVGEGRWQEKAALDFRNSSDRVRVKVPGSYEQLTIATWIKVDSIHLLSLPFIQSESKQPHSLFWVLHHGHGHKPMSPHFAETTLIPDQLGDRQTYFSTAKVFSKDQTGAWMHFAITIDNAEKKVTHYVNGRIADQHEIDNPRPIGIGLADIGNWPSRDWATDTKWEVRHLVGKMDEFLISQRAFPEAEILKLYRSGRP